MTDQVNPHRRRLPPAKRGRSQDQSRDAAILQATLELLAEKGYHALTMTDIAERAGVSKATLYRRWTAKADVVADAVATLSPMTPPQYPGTSLRDDLLALVAQVAQCDEQPEIVKATMEVARSHPDLYRTLTERSTTFLQTELGKLTEQAVMSGSAPLSAVELEVLSETAIAFLAHEGGPSGTPVSKERLVRFVDYALLVLLTGERAKARFSAAPDGISES